ncbi:MAG: RsbRD N-terminal domain-containing protein [Planctomycetota bacterium]
MLSTYPAAAAKTFARRKDAFANPVGHSLRVGTAGILTALLDGMDDAVIRQHLDEIIRIRAVQQLTATQAVGFVFRLRDAVRAELGPPGGDPTVLAELAEIDRRIDAIALAAFDVYASCREQVCELRINEVKRQVSVYVETQSECEFSSPWSLWSDSWGWGCSAPRKAWGGSSAS